MIERLLSHVSLHSLPNAGQRYELNRKQTSKNALLTYEEEFFLSAGLHRGNRTPASPRFHRCEAALPSVVLLESRTQTLTVLIPRILSYKENGTC